MTSFAQRRLWFLEQLKPGSPDYLLPLALRLRGALYVTALPASLATIVPARRAARGADRAGRGAGGGRGRPRDRRRALPRRHLTGPGLEVEHIRERCCLHLPAFLVPSAFVLLAALPDPAPGPTAFDCPTGVRDIFENPTVERLVAEVERQLVEQISAMSDDEIALSLPLDI